MKNRIIEAALLVRQITDAEFEEADAMAADQLAYCSPLRPATSKEQNDLGRHNARVLKCLRELRAAILDAPEKAKQQSSECTGGGKP